MGIIRFIRSVFGKKDSGIKAPFLIISKNPDVIEYTSIETAIAELEKDSDIPKDKMEKIRASLEKLKNNGKVKIRNGEIIE